MDPVAAFLDASVWHGSLDEATAILRAHPEVAGSGIHAAAVLGDDAAVGRYLAADPASATVKGGPRGWDALTYLCFSKYLRLDRARSDGFVRAARALLDAGASADSGFFEEDHHPEPEFESALYGAAGVAHHAAVTRLLLEGGADPNDGEVVYHTPEAHENGALLVLVESGKLTADSLATMLLRKHDWHDEAGARYLLEHGADPNRYTAWGLTALHQAVRRDNSRAMVELLLDHGADPRLEFQGLPAVAMAARRGRGDLLDLFERRGIQLELAGEDGVLAACARGQAVTGPVELADPGRALAEFAGVGNTAGVRCLLDLGVDVAARFEDGDGYWGLARGTTALHSAAWRLRHETVKLLLARGAPVNAVDATGQSALALAVKGCVASYWTEMRSPESVEALLAAGASLEGVGYPSGYADVDALLARSGAKG